MDGDELVEYVESGNVTVEEVVDRLEPGAAYDLFYGGPVTPDIDDYHEEVHIAREGLGNSYAEEPEREIVTKDADGLEYLWLPVSFPLHDAPYMIGKKSAELGYTGEREATAENGAGMLGATGAATAAVIDVVTQKATDIDLIPDHLLLIGATAGLVGGNALRGRAAGIREEIYQDGLERIEEQAGDYTVTIY
ncbi:MAG: hypothetical protein SVY41_01585 [Candidatus Nanohaloarchaea archaeon]|nr:hypothetical protein [Candidatus Nanohaloarchaea archaeon]